MNDELEKYTKTLCFHLRVDYSCVFTGGAHNKERFVRYLLVRKFAGVYPMKSIASYLNIRPDSVSKLKLKFDLVYKKEPAFRAAIRYLQEIGVVELPTPPRTKELTEKLDLTLDHIDRTIAMLKKQKDEIFEIKKSLPQIW